MLEVLSISLLSVFAFVNLLFFISVIIKRNDIADVAWGPGIFLSSIVFYFSTAGIHEYSNIILNVATLLIGCWATRIFLHIGTRFIHKKEEDFRYKVWRDTWKFFYLRSYFQVYILQGFLMFVMSLAVLAVVGTVSNLSNLGYFFFVTGVVIAVFGLSFETIGDLQLNKFISLKKENKIADNIMKTGLWAKTRHPNYFGEVTFWFGILILSIPFLNLISLIPFLLISFLILKVSGIPMLEKKYDGDKEWAEYKKVTPAFFPKFF